MGAKVYMKSKIVEYGIFFGVVVLLLGAGFSPMLSYNSEASTRTNHTFLDKDTSSSSSVFTSWQWAVKAGGTGQDNAWSICKDANGNTYITGSFQDIAMFGTIQLSSIGGSDVFVAKLNSNGDWLWAVNGGGMGNEESRSVCVDSNGNIYICGVFNGTAMFGSTMLASLGYDDGFVAKLNSAGAWQWAVQCGGPGFQDFTAGICVDANGNPYITGFFMETAMFGTITLTCIGLCDVFVAKINTDGAWQWAVQSISLVSGNALGNDITRDSTGNLYISGVFQGPVLFGTTLLSSIGIFDAFVAKLDTTGVWQWAIQSTAAQSSIAYPSNIDVHTNGDSYITGWMLGTVVYGTTTLSCGSGDVLVAKISSAGTWLWAVQGGGTNMDTGLGISLDPDGNAYITGSFQDVAVFGTITLTSSGSSDVFVAKLSGNGVWLWAKRAGGTEIDGGRGLCLDSEGNIFLCGYFSGTALFGSISLTSSGTTDVFVAKLNSDGENQPPVFGTPSPMNGSMHTPLSFSWNIPINDPDGDPFSWTIQCSNSQSSSGSGSVNGTKSLGLSGLAYSKTYKIWVNATDPSGSGLYTKAWYTFTTQSNSPPNKPQRPSGETNGKINIAYTYTTRTTDPDGDQVSYLWDWGDGTTSDWLGPYASGADASAQKTWTQKGTYSCKVKAKDASGAESDWSEPLAVTMPCSYNPTQQLFERVFQWFPNAFPLLRKLMGY